MSISAEWYQFKDLKFHPLNKAVWVPLRAIEDDGSGKRFGDLGYKKNTFACGTLAVPLANRELGDKLGWSEVGVGHEVGHYADARGYKPVGEYWLDWEKRGPSAADLVLPQHFGWDDSEWHLNQDILFALRLKREGDVWVRPNEGFVDVVRLHRDANGQPTRLEIRAEHLKDYLAARQMALRVAWYRDRDSIINDAEHIPWLDSELTEEKPNFRFVARAYAVHEGSGSPLGSQSAVFHSWRTDVDPSEDVPEYGDETEDNTDYTSRTFSDQGAKAFRVEGEIWAEEWVEPAAHSIRVREDELPSKSYFITEASGTSQSADELNNEDIGKYLWFRPGVIPDLLDRRGGSLKWYSRDTGSIELTHGYYVYFGINPLGFVNAYAYDVAKLPEWQRRIWQGYNIPPDGGVSLELLDAQMRTRPAATMAPEKYVSQALNDLDDVFERRFGKRLFRHHSSTSEIALRLHRFRALDENGLFALAKDVVRVVIEALDVKVLHEIAPPTGEQGKGSLKSLERVLATMMSASDARTALTQLAGIYELRGADAHLPSAELDEAYSMAGVPKTTPPIYRGLNLLSGLMRTLAQLVTAFRADDVSVRTNGSE